MTHSPAALTDQQASERAETVAESLPGRHERAAAGRVRHSVRSARSTPWPTGWWPTTKLRSTWTATTPDQTPRCAPTVRH
jgi:hypothetical protein